jgi:hypothetical protein
MAEEILRFSQYESKAIIPLSTRVPGVYIQKLAIAGNSILSSLFVESLDVGASVLVEYFDYGVGSDVGEEYFLNSHELLSIAQTTNRILISNVHDKPYVKCTVVGGNVRFGVYTTVVVSSASDIDNALKKEAESVILTTDKGIPIVIYDTVSGDWRFARGTDGVQDVHIVGNVTIGEGGTPTFIDASSVTTPGIEQTLASYTVPALNTFNLLSGTVVCRQECSFQMYGDGSLIGSGRTGPGNPNVNFTYRISRSFVAGKIIEVKATARSGSAPSDIECYLQGTLS